MTTEHEAIKAGTKEAVADWLETTAGRTAVEGAVKSAVLDWVELSTTGQAQIPWGTERAVTAWLKDHEPQLLRAITQAVSRTNKP